MSNKGFFVISLDFELYWGMFDKVSLQEYGENIKGVHEAIPEMLSLFEDNKVRATWAAVGMLMSKNKAELMSSLPSQSLRPLYKDMRVSSYSHIEKESIGEGRQDDPYHYGAHLIEKIIRTEGQELGSHTFSHYYCIDGKENSKEIFDADCQAARASALRFGKQMSSIVFPRNQTTQNALLACKENGFLSYRGTPRHFLYTAKKEHLQTNIFLRALRLIDAYINISGHHTYSLASVEEPILANVQGSRFLRPYSRSLRHFEPLKLERIKSGMTHAAKNNKIFHLWWHPHNFGINRKQNLQALLELIAHYTYLHGRFGMESASMEDIARYANGPSDAGL